MWSGKDKDRGDPSRRLDEEQDIPFSEHRINSVSSAHLMYVHSESHHLLSSLQKETISVVWGPTSFLNSSFAQEISFSYLELADL